MGLSASDKNAKDRELNNFTNNSPVGTRQCRVPTREFALNSILIPKFPRRISTEGKRSGAVDLDR